MAVFSQYISSVIELKKDGAPQKIQNQLYRYTQLQTAFNANMVMLVNNEPKLMGLKSNSLFNNQLILFTK
jgi:DNA gyrase/topoisomerase IV subunit A